MTASERATGAPCIGDLDARILDWLGRTGAAAAAEVAAHLGCGEATARAQLASCARRGLVRRVRLLEDAPSLYVATRAGLRAAQLQELATCRVSPSGFAHLVACARVAVALERIWPQAYVAGERELRLAERRAGAPVASAELAAGAARERTLHRPDLVVFADRGVLAVEVELTVKAPARLARIVGAWARCRLVDRVAYLASPAATRAVGRAVVAMRAQPKVAVIELEALLGGPGPSEAIAVAG